MDSLKDIVDVAEEGKLREIFSKQNQGGETEVYVAPKYGYVDTVGR